MKAFSPKLVAGLLAALLLGACTSTGGGQGATDQSTVTSTPTVTPGAESSPGTSTGGPSPSLSGASLSPSNASPTASGTGARRLCDTKVESANPVLRNVRFGRHDTYDRLAFDFCKPADTTLKVRVVKQLIEDASGKKVTLKGQRFVAITLTPADAHTGNGRLTVATQAVTVAGRNMQQYKLIGDFEGVVTYGVGFRRIEPTATAIRSDSADPRHIILYFDLGPQSG